MSEHVHVSAGELFDSSTGLLEVLCSAVLIFHGFYFQSNKSMQLQCGLYIFTGRKVDLVML